jgi:hypothetical protein
MGDKFIGGYADGRTVGIDMAVQVDQARRHQLAGGIDDAQCTRIRDICLHRLDRTKSDSDIAAATQRLAGIEHIATLDKQIEFVIRPHRGMRTANPCSGSKRGSRGKKVSA